MKRVSEVLEAAVGFPSAPVLPAVATGATDSRFVRELGIVAYGYIPIVVPQQDSVGGVHGNDERVSVDNIRRGVAMMLEIVRKFASN